jgi:hypothetical protein
MFACLLALFVAGCAPQDRVVGSNRLIGSQDATTPLDARETGPLVLSTDFATDEGLWDRQRVVPGSTITFGGADALARDGAEVVLRLPGIPGLGPNDHVGPDVATQIATTQFVKLGTLRSRLRFPVCGAAEEAVSAAFAFFNDGSDANGNGLADNPELDFQVLCGTPSFIVLTVWKDFGPGSDGTTHFFKTSHAVDTSNGDLYDLASPSAEGYVRSGNDRTLALPGFPDPNTFYELGFEWRTTSVRFFVVSAAKELTLWTMSDRAYVPAVPLQVMYNVWHPATHWVPRRDSANYPSADATLRVDWLEYRAP